MLKTALSATLIALAVLAPAASAGQKDDLKGAKPQDKTSKLCATPQTPAIPLEKPAKDAVLLKQKLTAKIKLPLKGHDTPDCEADLVAGKDKPASDPKADKLDPVGVYRVGS